jgi:hypothetical protein
MMHSQQEIREVLLSITESDREFTRMPPEEVQKLSDLIERYE